VTDEEATDASASEPAVVELAGATEAAVQTYHAAAPVEEATVASVSDPTVVESVSALDASVFEDTAEAVATGNEATDACTSEPAVVESVGAAPAATMVDPFVSPPDAPLTIPQSAHELVVAGPHADRPAIRPPSRKQEPYSA
jgi:hypothetical protein